MTVDWSKYKKIGNFTLSSGKKSKYYYDIKEAMGEPHNLHLMFGDFVTKIPPNTDLFIGLEYGGIPLAITCSLLTGKPYAILRKNKKRHGTLTKIEGYKKTGNAVLLDDVLTTGNSIKKATKFLTKKGYMITETITVLNRGDLDN